MSAHSLTSNKAVRVALKIVLGLLIFLALSTAAVKIFHMEEEMVLFRNIGFSDTATVLFGIVQGIAGLLLLTAKTRKLGAAILIPTFIIATYALFANGVFPFAPLSLLFIVMAALMFVPTAPAAA